MNLASLVLLILGAGNLAKGIVDLPKIGMPLHHLQRERFHQRRSRQAWITIAIGLGSILLAFAVRGL